MNTQRIAQFVRYCIVGVANTLVTFCVIYITKSILGWNEYLCNVLGYVAGLTNSFLLNKAWTFRSKGSYGREILHFALGFIVCYLLQLWTVYMLNSSTLGTLTFRIAGITVSGYGIATVLGNVVYTLANFIYNKLITFRARQ